MTSLTLKILEKTFGMPAFSHFCYFHLPTLNSIESPILLDEIQNTVCVAKKLYFCLIWTVTVKVPIALRLDVRKHFSGVPIILELSIY